jgi:hypothetical protein
MVVLQASAVSVTIARRGIEEWENQPREEPIFMATPNIVLAYHIQRGPTNWCCRIHAGTGTPGAKTRCRIPE